MPSAASFLRCDQCAAAAAEGVEYDIRAFGCILDRIGDQVYWLDRWMHGELVEAAGAECIHAGVFPNIGAVSAMPPELDVVGVRLRAGFEEQNQLVF